MTIPLLYQLQDATYDSLSSGDFRVAVVDPDDSTLTATQVSTLQEDQDKTLYAYTSIGEAEDYRDYWDENDWDTTPPDFLLEENADWEGNYRVEFWDEDWQAIIFDRVKDVVDLGYNGIYLDIVDGYTVDEVIAAYSGTEDELRQEMIDFVISISEYAKSLDPDFEVIPQNAVGLLAVSEDSADSGPNTAYLDAIDGLGVEDLWYNDDEISDWTDGDLSFMQLAQDDGKFVLATSYPTEDASQETFIDNAIAEGLIPFAAERDLTGVIDEVNEGTEAKMEASDAEFNEPWEETTTVEPTSVVGQTDTLTVTQADADEWQSVSFDGSIEDAVVIMSPLSADGSDPVTVRVRNVTDDGFEFQIDEWDYLDGSHMSADVSWMAASAGDYVLDDGRAVSFGSTTASDETAVDVDLTGFDTTPVVVTQVGSDNDTDNAVTSRNSDVTADGFSVAMQEEESADGIHTEELVYWMAVEEGDGDLSAVILEEGVDHNWTDTGLDATDYLFADMQTSDGNNTATLRYDVDDAGSVSMRVQEETSGDTETWHVEEQIGAVSIVADEFILNVA